MTGAPQARTDAPVRALIAALPDAVAITDAAGHILEWNRPAAALFGHDASAVSGMLVTQLLAGEEVSLQEVTAAAPEGADSGDKKRVVELLATRGDGSVFQCELSSSSFRVDGENRCVLVFRDIADRSRAQLALQQSEDKYRALALYAPVGIVETDASGKTTFVNRRWTEVTGYTEDDVLRKGWEHGVHPEDLERVRRTASAARASAAPLSMDYRVITKHGEIAWVNGASVRLTDPYGVTTGYLSSIVDVTARKRALAALSASEANFRSLVERAPFGVVVCRARKVVYANRTYLDMLGFSDLTELTGRVLLPAVVHPDALAYATQRERERDAGIVLSPAAIRCVRKDGSEIFIEEASTYIIFDGEHAQVIVARDVTDRERADQARQQLERATLESLREKEVLLKEIHHRVKNNLQMIVSLINLQAAKLDDPATRSVFEETRSRVHAIALLHERLYGSRNLGRIDMADYLAGLASDLGSTNVDPRPIALRVEAEDLYLEMDAAVPIGLIVNELVTNAYKHAFPPRLRQSGQIRVELRREGDTIALAVSDDGIGYPASLDPTHSDTLGLLLISSLSQQLDGETTFEHEGQGARCVVRFPARGTQLSDFPRSR